jgi:uncharacterized membrane protein (DUF4010 family)
MDSLAKINDLLPEDFYKFLIVVLFSLVIGLEQRSKNRNELHENTFGSDRTFTLIGILGFVMYKLNTTSLAPFLLGALILSLFLAIFYKRKVDSGQRTGITTLIVALITYCLAPTVYTQPYWMVILLVVTVLVLVEIKETLFEFSKKMDNREFITLAKFLIIAGVILPILPNQPISGTIDISPYKFWMAIVAVSGISYLSYLLKKFVFPDTGIVLTGILGGLYSSTATTFILARKSKELNETYQISAAIIFATSMMFLRILVLAFIFNRTIAIKLASPFLVLFLVSLSIAFWLLYLDKKNRSGKEIGPDQNRNSKGVESDQNTVKDFGNPLEIKTALIFGALFVFFAVVTHFVSQQFGAHGIKVLSFLVGVTDIDPFIINIFQNKFIVADNILVIAVVNAVTSNNLLKMVYAAALSVKPIRRYVFIGFGILILFGIATSLII